MKEQDIIDSLEKQHYIFSSGFSDRVMGKIQAAMVKGRSDFDRALDYLFPRMSLGTGLALTIIFLSMYFSYGTLDIDVIMGFEDFEKNAIMMDYGDVY